MKFVSDMSLSEMCFPCALNIAFDPLSSSMGMSYGAPTSPAEPLPMRLFFSLLVEYFESLWLILLVLTMINACSAGNKIL